MNGELKTEYRNSFMALSTLQAVQLKRKERQINSISDIKIRLNIYGSRQNQHEPLWTVEELVSPIASKVTAHFSKWLQKPELVFALAYRLAEEYADTIDELLQPMLDEANVEGYSAREEWVRAISAMAAEHIRVRALPAILKDFDGDGLAKEAKTLWLHTVDQAIDFDRKMHALAAKGLGLSQISTGEISNIELVLGDNFSCLSVFADRSDWLEIWAKLELTDAQEKIRFELEQERAWFPANADTFESALDTVTVIQKVKYDIQGKYLFLSMGSSRAPVGASFVMSILWAVIDRCRPLPDVNQRLDFLRLAALPVAQDYFKELVERCREAEALTALVDEDDMAKVAICVNAAAYCELTLQEWGEDIFFLEMKHAALLAGGKETRKLTSASLMKQDDMPQLEGSIFDNVLDRYRQFKAEWVGKLVSAVSRDFESHSWDYLRNKKRWLEEGTDNPRLEDFRFEQNGNSSKSNDSEMMEKNSLSLITEVSSSLVDALALLRSQLLILQKSFDEIGYFEFWRQVAASLDQLLFGVALSGIKFSVHGRLQFVSDVNALLRIFKPFCVRPASFFPKLNDTIKLLTMPSTEGLQIVQQLSSMDSSESKLTLNFLRQHGVRKLSPADVQKILNARTLSLI